MARSSTQKTVINNFLWRFMERCGAQGVTFIVSIVLARVLGPEVYGTVALVTVFTTIMQVFVDSGLGMALIQKKEADDLDFSTVFYFNVAACTVLYLIMFFAAPAISHFYNRGEELVPVIRVLSVVLIISGLKNIQHAYVSRHMLFKRFFFATLAGTIGAAIIGITMAFLGYGVWALVAQHVFNTLVDTTVLWITVKWRPKRMFSFERLKSLLSYGWKLLAAKLIDTVYNDLRQLIIGKKYSSSDLAYYDHGKKVPYFLVTNINTSIDSVLLPAMSNVQENKERVRAMTRRAIKTSTFILMPLMMGVAVCGDALVDIVLTSKWLPCVFFLRIFCFSYAFHPIHTANLNAIKAMGRSDIFLRLEIMKKVIGLTAVLITMWISVEAMACSVLVTSVISQIINAWPNRKLLDYSYADQIKDMLPQIGLSCLMGVIVYAAGHLCTKVFGFGDWLTLLIQVPLGIIIYVGGSKLFHIDSFEYALKTLKSYFSKGKKEEA